MRIPPQWDNHTDAFGIVHFGAVLQNEVHYCNFASDVFSRAVFDRYVARVCGEIENAPGTAEQMGGRFERQVDSIYFGGGTPTILEVAQTGADFCHRFAKFQRRARGGDHRRMRAGDADASHA